MNSATRKPDWPNPTDVGLALRSLRDFLQTSCVGARAGFFSEELLARLTGIPRLELPLHRSRPLSDTHLRQLESEACRLACGEPLQYVLGFAAFMDLKLHVDSRVLIPRPETEILVQEVLAASGLWDRKDTPPRIADVGTGSGCIALALAARHPEAQIFAVDASSEALEVAELNAESLGLGRNIRFFEGDLLTQFAGSMLDAVVSNPPYVTELEYGRLDVDVRDFEPRQALVGGCDGLAVVRRLAHQAWEVLRPQGWLFLEVGCSQATETAGILTGAGFENPQVIRDLAGRERVLKCRKP